MKPTTIWQKYEIESLSANPQMVQALPGLERDPSEQVLEAGEGGGGIEAESLSSFCLSFEARGSSGSLGFLGGCKILKRQVSVRLQAELRSCPTFGTPPEASEQENVVEMRQYQQDNTRRRYLTNLK